MRRSGSTIEGDADGMWRRGIKGRGARERGDTLSRSASDMAVEDFGEVALIGEADIPRRSARGYARCAAESRTPGGCACR